MSETATYARLWLKVQRRAPLVLGPLMLLVVVAGVLQQQRQAQQAREVMAFYQEEARRLYSELDLCRQPPLRSLRATREGATLEDVGGTRQPLRSLREPTRSLREPTREGATPEDVGGTRGSSHWLGTIHHPEQPPRRNGPPEGEAAKP